MDGGHVALAVEEGGFVHVFVKSDVGGRFGRVVQVLMRLVAVPVVGAVALEVDVVVVRLAPAVEVHAVGVSAIFVSAIDAALVEDEARNRALHRAGEVAVGPIRQAGIGVQCDSLASRPAGHPVAVVAAAEPAKLCAARCGGAAAACPGVVGIGEVVGVGLRAIRFLVVEPCACFEQRGAEQVPVAFQLLRVEAVHAVGGDEHRVARFGSRVVEGDADMGLVEAAERSGPGDGGMLVDADAVGLGSSHGNGRSCLHVAIDEVAFVGVGAVQHTVDGGITIINGIRGYDIFIEAVVAQRAGILQGVAICDGAVCSVRDGADAAEVS